MKTEAQPEVVPRNGFDLEFLSGHELTLPELDPSLQGDIALTLDGALVRQCTHFSLQMSTSRRFCRWVAWNIDGTQIQRLSRGGFKRDSAYDVHGQVGDEIYQHNKIDRGHIARRADVTWGSEVEAAQANADSMFFTNITPQASDFNEPLPATYNKGLWGELENSVFAEIATIDDHRLAVFGGPVLDAGDFPYKGVLIPRSFWKIVAYSSGGALQARAFVLTQADLEHRVLETIGWEDFGLYRHRIAELEQMIGVQFGPLAGADVFPKSTTTPALRISRREDIVA